MAIALRYAARSDIGLGRYTNNQDSGYAGPHLLVIADGMGGHSGGDVASSITVGRMVALDGESHGGDALALMARALREANAELARRAAADPALAGMGTTTTALMRYGNKLALAHIGDSRAYLLRDGDLTRLTRDHSFVQSLVDEGRITAEEAETHPQRSVVTRVLTGDPDDEPDLSVREARVGDRYLICSDGLTDVVRDTTLAEALATHREPAASAEALVQMALRGGARDNVSCIVAHVVDVDDEVDAGSSPQVIGAAAVHGTVRSAASASTPAAKAAALGQSSGASAAGPAAQPNGSLGQAAGRGGGTALATEVADPQVDATDPALVVAPPASKRRWAMRTLLALLMLALVAGGGYAAYAWSQDQYFVAADGEAVAIYRGLPQDIGPVRLSSVYERADIELASLPQYSREQVSEAITADNLNDARSKVQTLRAEAEACGLAAAPTGTPSVTPTGTPSVTATPSTPSSTASPTAAPAVPSPLSTASSTPTPLPTTSTTPPDGCAGAT